MEPDARLARWKLPWDAHCRCEGVALRITQPPLLAMACHCTGCQHMSSSAFSLTLAIPKNGFEISKGEPVVGGLHGPTRHMFCRYCMTWMFTYPEGIDAFVNLRATLLDEAKWFAPFVETWTSEKLPWASTPAVHSFAKLPELSQYDELIRAYAETGAHP